MFNTRVALKTAVLVWMAVWMAVALAGCGTVSQILITPTKWKFSSVTPQPERSTTPSLAAAVDETLTPVWVNPVQQGTPLQKSGKMITAENANALKWMVDTGQGQPLHMLLSTDGKQLGVSTTNGVYVYDSVDLKLLLVIRTGERQTSLAFSADGSLMASGDWRGRVGVWDTAGNLKYDLDAGKMPILAAAFSPDGNRLAVSGWDGLVSLWDLNGGDLERKLRVRNNVVKAVSFSADGSRLYGWGVGESIQVWRVEDGKALDDIYLGKDPNGFLTSKVIIGQQGDEAAVFYTRSVKVFTTRNGYTRMALNDLTNVVEEMALSGNGNFLAVMTKGDDASTQISIHDLQSSSLAASVLPQTAGVHLLIALSPDGKILYTAGAYLQSWDLTAGGSISQAQMYSQPEFLPEPVIGSLAVNGNLVYLAEENGSLETYDLSFGSYTPKWNNPALLGDEQITSSAIWEGRLAAFGGRDGGVNLVDLQNEDTITQLQKHKRTVRCLAFSKDGTLLVSASDDGQVLVHNLAAGSTVMDVNAGKAVYRVYFGQADTPGGYVILQTADEIQIWSMADGVLQKQLAAQGLAVSADGKFLAGVSLKGYDATVDIYKLPDGGLLQSYPLEGYRLAISPDGGLLAMAGRDLTLWSISDGRLLRRLEDIHCCGELKFTPEGSLLLQVFSDGSIQAWGIP